MSLLSITDLSVARGGRTVLEGLNFALGQGEVLILRGPNGSGKTTLLRTLAGLQNPQSGTVNCAEDSIAYGGHADGLKSTLTVAENLRFWAGVYGEREITPALEAFNLTSLVNRQAGTLSAGQKRRLGLARLLVTRRPVWILDEPTVSLDTGAVELFASAVRKHIFAGGAAIIATHIDLGFEAQTFDVTPFKAMENTSLGAFDEAFL
jgi:heme exporter protein A